MTQLNINILEKSGSFAENKDIAKEIRVKKILPLLEKDKKVILDFEKVDTATQSFIHALISDVIRKYGISVLDRVRFKSCNGDVRKIINIVVDYMQDALDKDKRNKV
jgi:hypothetical protein